MKNNLLKNIVFTVFIIALCLLTFSLIWTRRFYGNIGFEEIVFHLRMPVEGTSEVILKSFAKNCIFPTTVCLLGWIAIHIPIGEHRLQFEYQMFNKKYELQIYPLKLSRKLWTGIIFCWIGGIIGLAHIFFGFGTYLVNQYDVSKFIE